MYKQTEIIAEVKTESPSGYKSKRTWDELFQIANETGDIISIHTDPKWGGSFDLVKRARALTNKSILAKGIHTDDSLIQQAVDAGADWVLVVVGEGRKMPTVHIEKCLIEPLTLRDLATIPTHLKVVWNSRDLLKSLQSGKEILKLETFEEARALFRGWLCQASNIKTVTDIKKGANAVLVGTYIFEFAASLPQHES